MSKYIHNISGQTKSYLGTEVANNAFFLIPADKHIAFSNNNNLLTDLATGAAKMSSNGQTDIPGGASDQINFLKQQQVNSVEYPFASKIISDGKKLFRRVHGISGQVTGSSTKLSYTVPYVQAKITGIEIINAEIGDSADFKVYDNAQGTLSGVPNYMLNQFGFNVYLSEKYHEDSSQYDADLIQGLKLEVDYNSVSTKTVYINFVLHEIKD